MSRIERNGRRRSLRRSKLSAIKENSAPGRSINLSVFITEAESVYSAVGTGSLNKAVCALSLKG